MSSDSIGVPQVDWHLFLRSHQLRVGCQVPMSLSAFDKDHMTHRIRYARPQLMGRRRPRGEAGGEEGTIHAVNRNALAQAPSPDESKATSGGTKGRAWEEQS